MAQLPWRRRPAVALLLIGLGLALLGYAAWEYYGTNITAHRHRDQVLHQLDEAWRTGHGQARTGRGTARAVVRIPRFGDDYRVPVLEGTSARVLATGFGHETGTAGPGQVGNFVIAGHRVTHGEPLRDMPDLRPGDLVLVDTATTTFTYRLTTGGDDLVVPLTATWVLDPAPVNPDGGAGPPAGAGQRLITIVTCAELFHTDDRMVAFGVLVGSGPRRP